MKNNVGINLSLTWDENLNLFTKVEYYIDDELINFRHKTLDKFEKAKNKPVTEETGSESENAEDETIVPEEEQTE